jgi:hypothetical protein
MKDTAFIFNTSKGKQIYKLPSAFKNISSVYFMHNETKFPIGKAEIVSMKELYSLPYSKDVTAIPSAYCLNSDCMRVWPIPDGEYEIYIELGDAI